MPSPITVTATQGGATGPGLVLRVYVLTGAAAAQNGAAVNSQVASTNFTQSITTTQTGSEVYGAALNYANTAATPAALTTVVDNVADGSPHFCRYTTFKATSQTGTPGPTTLGFTVSGGTGGPLALAEILSNSGSMAEDPSAPPPVSDVANTTVTTNSFTPPGGALLVACVGSNGTFGGTTMGVSGGGVTWTELSVNNPSGGQYAGIWIAQLPPPSGNDPVITATQGGATAPGMSMRVMVLTSAAAVQTGATVNSQVTSATAFTQAITTTQTGSRVYGAAGWAPQSSASSAALTSLIDGVADGTNNAEYATFKATSLTGTPGATTLGVTAGSAGTGPLAMAEILTAGTLTEDGSAPAVASATSATFVSCANFTAPGGSLLVALVSSNGGAGVTTMGVSGGGLTWTELVKNNPSSGHYAGVWIAQVPAVVLQSASGFTSTSALSAAYASNLSAGTKLICAVEGATQTVTAVKDTAGNSFTQLATVTSTSYHLYLFALDTPAGDVGGVTTVTATLSGTANGASILIQEVSGLRAGNTAAMLDGAAGTLASSGTASSAFTTGSPSYSSTAAGEYLVCVGGDDGDGGLYSWPPAAGYTGDAHAVNANGSGDLNISYKSSTGGAETGSYTTTKAAGTGSVHWAVILAAFRVGPAVAPASPSAQPGQTWLRRFRHRQHAQAQPPAGAVTIIATAGLAGTGAVAALATQAATAVSAGAGTVTAAVTEIPATASLAGAGAVTAVVTEAAKASPAGASAVADVVTQAVTASPAGAGTVTAAVTQIAPAAAAGAGAVTGVVTQACTAALAGAGAVTANASVITPGNTAALAGAGAVSAVATVIVPATVAGAGAVSAVVTEAAPAAAVAAGSVTAVVTEAPTAALAGAGVLGPVPATQAVTAAPAGAGAVADVVNQAVTASLTGAGAVAAIASSGGASTATLAGTGAVTAVATVIAPATVAAAGTVTAVAAQAAKATAAGAGSLSANGQITGTAGLAGTGALTALAAQAAVSALAGAGALTAVPAQRAPAVLAAAGSLTAAGSLQVAFTIGALSASTAATATQAPADKAASALGAASAASSVITAGDQRTGGPG